MKVILHENKIKIITLENPIFSISCNIIFQFLFKRKLSLLQWIALFILTIGVIVQRISFFDDKVDNGNTKENDVSNSEHLQLLANLGNLFQFILSNAEMLWILLQVNIII